MTDEIGMTLEDMESVASGEVLAPQQEEQPQNDGQADDADQDESDEVEAEEPQGEGEQEEPATDSEEKPRMNRASLRVKDAVDRANDAERRMQELDFKLQQQMAANEKLVAMVTGGDKPPAQDADEEVLDEVLAKKMDAKFAKIEDMQYEAVKQQEVAYIGGEQGEVYQKAIAAHAIEVMRKANAIGQPVSQTVAENLATQSIENGIRELQKRGAKQGAIAQELVNAATYYDFLASQTQQTARQKPPAGVNMKKVEEARRKAGAPTIDKESVNISGGMNAFQSEIKKAKGSIDLSDDYLRKLGFA